MCALAEISQSWACPCISACRPCDVRVGIDIYFISIVQGCVAESLFLLKDVPGIELITEDYDNVLGCPALGSCFLYIWVEDQ